MNAAFKEILNFHINDSDLIQLSFCENLCLCTNFDTAVKLRLESLVVLLTAGRMVSIGPGTEPRWHMMLVKCLQWYSSWPSGFGAGNYRGWPGVTRQQVSLVLLVLETGL